MTNPIVTTLTTHRYATRTPSGRVVPCNPVSLADAAAFDAARYETRHLPPHRRIGRWTDEG